MDFVIGISCNDRETSCLIWLWRGFCGEGAVVVVRVGDGAGFGIRGGQEAGKRIVSESARAPVCRVRIVAFLIDGEEIAQRIVGVIGFVVEAGWVFPNCGEATEAVGLRFAGFARFVGGGGEIVA